MKEWAFQTRAIHAGIDFDSTEGSTVTPIYESAAFAYDSPEELSEVFEGKTLTPPFLFPARRFGVSVVVYSATKYISGNGTAVGGAIVDLGTFDWTHFPNEGIREMAARRGGQLGFHAAARKNVLQNIGSCLSPFSASRHSQGLETLALRMERHCSNVFSLAEFLTVHPRVSAVNYPGLVSSAYRERVREQ
jgi:O-acetylhomoserine (thiol)-lyase